MRTAESGDTSRKVYSRDGDTTVDARLHNVAMVPGNDDSVFVGWFACVKFFFSGTRFDVLTEDESLL